MPELNRPNILYSCYTQKNREGEQFVPEHVFGYQLSGTLDITLGGTPYALTEGTFSFFRKNQLARFIKQPPPGGEFRSVSVFLDQEALHEISDEHNLKMDKPYSGDGGMILKPNALFKNYMDSLSPYIDGQREFSPILTKLKVKEAVMILLESNPALKDVLFDFSAPGKIDLEAYMNEHYKFNVDTSRFAYLTGRSLATFKRDFEKVFHTSPNRWLQQKRLNDAYYLIKEKGWRSSDVYLEVGFKDLSHFSFAFKKTYGIAPSRLDAKN
jgi:AraC-like DNA-binding protein